MRTPIQPHQQGFVLIMTMIMLMIITSVTYLLNRDSFTQNRLIKGESERLEMDYISEAALNHVEWMMNNNGCTNYVNIPTTSLGGHSYSAVVSPNSGSPVTVTATAVHSNGNLRSKTYNNISANCGCTSNPVNISLTAVKDSTIRSSKPTKNYGGDNKLKIEQNQRDSLIEFDLTSLPANSIINNAQLKLFYLKMKRNFDTQLDFHLITTMWVEGTGNNDGVTWNDYDGNNPWNTPGGDYEPNPVASLIFTNADPVDVYKVTDLTTPVSNWYTGAKSNFGLMLTQTLAANRLEFGSREGNAGEFPVLDINYTPPCSGNENGGGNGGGGNGDVSVSLVISADSSIKSDKPDENRGAKTDIRSGELKNAVERYRGLIQFDHSAIPANSTIVSANLRFWVIDVKNATGATLNLTIHPFTTTWTENLVTWNTPWTTPGGDFLPSVASVVVPSGNIGIWIETDLSPLVQEWVDNISVNNGLLIQPTPDISERVKFNSKESGATGFLPELVVVYTP